MNTKLYVGNLPEAVSEKELQDLFSPHGPVNEVKIIRDRDTGGSRGFGFVTMATAEAAQAAMQGLQGKEIHGRAMTVKEAIEREPRSGGSNRFGGGGPRREPRSR